MSQEGRAFYTDRRRAAQAHYEHMAERSVEHRDIPRGDSLYADQNRARYLTLSTVRTQRFQELKLQEQALLVVTALSPLLLALAIFGLSGLPLLSLIPVWILKLTVFGAGIMSAILFVVSLSGLGQES